MRYTPHMQEETRDHGTQPLDEMMTRWGLTNHDLVDASVEQLNHKQVQKARKGRQLTLHLMQKISRAAQRGGRFATAEGGAREFHALPAQASLQLREGLRRGVGRSERSPAAEVNAPRWTIVGQGLAGTCLAWEFWKRGVSFSLVDRERGGSSRVAAGLINPITGKNFEPSARIAGFHPQAMEFYAEVGDRFGGNHLAPAAHPPAGGHGKEWGKMLAKTTRPDVAPWLAHGGVPQIADGWVGALEVTGGGRLDTRAFLDRSREFFRDLEIYQPGGDRRRRNRPDLVRGRGRA